MLAGRDSAVSKRKNTKRRPLHPKSQRASERSRAMQVKKDRAAQRRLDKALRGQATGAAL